MLAAPDPAPVRIGVLAMQGAFAEHVRALEASGAVAFEVRTAAELERCDGIVLPGGESTAIRKALDRCGLLEPLRARLAAGLPAFGTCAGMIVLADAPADGAPPCFGLLDVDVERNGFGRQAHSAEARVELDPGFGSDPGPGPAHALTHARAHVRGVFIRAPRITRLGKQVEVVGRAAVVPGAAAEPVVIAQGALLAASFHPELTDDRTLHELFVARVRANIATRAPAAAAHG